MFTVIETFEDTIIINKIQVPVRIEVKVAEDDDAEQVVEGADTFLAVILVEATGLGETGTDVLGGCELRCNNMFNSEPFESDLFDMVADNGMINTAKNDLEALIKARANTLKPFAE